MRRLAFTATALLLLAACGGGDGDGEDASSTDTAKEAVRSFEGAFAGTSLTTESTVKDDKKVGEKEEVTYYLSCADKGCAKVHQRSSEVTGRDGGTWLFERDDNDLVAVDVLTGACTEPATGEYTQRLTWTWVIGDDGTMTGELLQDFKGCDLDSTSRTETTMVADGKPLPYIANPGGIVAALNAYNDAAAPLYAESTACHAQIEDPATIAEGAACLQRTVGTWVGGLAELEKATAGGPPENAPEKCRESWQELPAVSTVLNPATQARDGLTEANISAAVNEHLQAAFTTNEPLQTGLMRIAYSCISPDVAAADLGEGGRLVLDTEKILVANSEPVSGG
ncbi:MAG TPA: hypothetical protein VM933_00980 [Acidimicrobiales bacterium]|nr:hypothetical protein [Acidimicrobiales bacterium]